MEYPLLQVKSLVHRFQNGKYGLDKVSLEIRRGEFIVLAGPNGSGKTLLMRHLNGLLSPESGSILLDGKSIYKDIARTRRRIGLMFQNAEAQIVGQSVSRDAAFGPENLKIKRDEIERRVTWALESTGLTGFDNRQPHTLSGGEMRRLTVAGVLAMYPDIIILDEPFIGLDWMGCADLIEVLLFVHARGTAILLISHDMEKVLAHADRLILMKDGKIHADGDPKQLLTEAEAIGVRRPPGELSDMTWRRK